MTDVTVTDVIVIGSGPAGLNAALYTARANLATTVVVGPQLGGQVSLTWEIDNYLGFHEDLTGAELTERMVKHAEKFGAELAYDEVIGVDFSGQPLRVRTYGGELAARAVIISAGASARRLGVPGEEELTGRGVSYCATCDGAFFRGEDVLVVGGGDSAVEEALFLTRFARSVRLVHRRGELRAGRQLIARAMANDKISILWHTSVQEILGNAKVSQVRSQRTDTGEVGLLDATGVFIFIGHTPNSEAFQGVIDMDSHGYVLVDERMRTNVPGVFAAGEIMDPIWRQVATSVGQGCAAGMAAERYLAEQGA
jgi:thioredoxin reductase (NADPH)